MQYVVTTQEKLTCDLQTFLTGFGESTIPHFIQSD